jgi:hypothetical protein
LLPDVPDPDESPLDEVPSPDPVVPVGAGAAATAVAVPVSPEFVLVR